MPNNGYVIQAIFAGNPDQYPPIINSTRLLAQAGYAVDIVCLDTGKEWGIVYPPTSKIRRIGANSRNSWTRYARFVSQVLRQADKNAALFVGHDMHGLLPAWLLATRYRRPLVYHCHDFAESGRRLSPGSHLVRLIEHRLARVADIIIVPDFERAQVIIQELDLKRAPIVVANAPLRKSGSCTGLLREALLVRSCDFDQVLFRQGSIGPNHAIEATIRSIPMWQNPRWGFVVMGIGEAEYLDHINHLANRLSVKDQFVILPPVGYDEVGQFTVEAQAGHGLYDPVNINHTFATTGSNKIMEYMAAGLPLLVSDRPGLRQLVKKYECGLTADESSPESIARAVNTLLGDPAAARAMGAAGARAFQEEFCYERQFAPVLQAFKELIRSSRKGF